MHNSSDSNNIMKRVRTQLRVAQNHFNKTFKDVRIVYSKVRDESAPHTRDRDSIINCSAASG